MNPRSPLMAPLIAALLWLPAAQAQTAVQVQNEVNFLLGYVAGPGCELLRNGTWHDTQKAHVHLRDKYKYLVEKNLAETTEHVIERATSQSSFSGRPYQIRCADGVAFDSQQWLSEKLVQLRTLQ